jgi:hypothetical protein
LTLICLKEVEKMRDAFKTHTEKRISEMQERVRNSRIKKKEKVIIFSQHAKKACKDIN